MFSLKWKISFWVGIECLNTIALTGRKTVRTYSRRYITDEKQCSTIQVQPHRQ